MSHMPKAKEKIKSLSRLKSAFRCQYMLIRYLYTIKRPFDRWLIQLAGKPGLRIRITFVMRILDQLFILMRNRIQIMLFLSGWCVTATILSLHGPPHHFEPLNFLNFDFNTDPDPDPAFLSNANPDPASKNNADPYLKPCVQCCGSGMFIPDPNFFHPGSDTIQDFGSASKNLSIFTKKNGF